MMLSRYFLWVVLLLFTSCSVQQRISKAARIEVFQNGSLATAHVGITIYDPVSGKYLYDYQGDKYFVPASNTKIATCYAALRYLGDSIPAFYYREEGDRVVLDAAGDPTFLHPQFEAQHALRWLRSTDKPIHLSIAGWKDQPWGSGWSWNDYEEPYMAERSAMPIYGNVLRMEGNLQSLKITPSYFSTMVRDSTRTLSLFPASVHRPLTENTFTIRTAAEKPQAVEQTFFTAHGNIIFDLLADTLGKPVHRWIADSSEEFRVLYSQATDSVLLPMMHNSDNFLAEQTLMMVSRRHVGIMRNAFIIDTILKTDLSHLAHKPRWVDGSGLSRYNLFTPQSLVQLLDQMRREYGMDRLRHIFPTGNQGTLRNYYRKDSGFLFAKTGTLSGVVALSGFLYTSHNRLLLFSVLINNHQAPSATVVRRAVESFLSRIRDSF